MLQSTQIDNSDSDSSFIVSGGLFDRLLIKIGLGQRGAAGGRIRAACFVFFTYIPLLILALMQGVAYAPNLQQPFLYDVSEATRFLIVGPLLILSEAIVEPWLVQVVKHVRDRLLVEEQLTQYERLLQTGPLWEELRPGRNLIVHS